MADKNQAIVPPSNHELTNNSKGILCGCNSSSSQPTKAKPIWLSQEDVMARLGITREDLNKAEILEIG